MTDYQTRNGRTGSRSWFWPLLLYLAVLGLLFTAATRAQAQTQETKIITIPPPSPTPVQRPGGSSAGPTAAVPAEAVEFPPAAAGSEIGARVGMPSPLPRQDAVPRVIPIEPLPGQLQGQTPTAARPKVIQLRRDSTGLLPALPPGPTPRRTYGEVAGDVSNLIEKILEPEAEIALVAGECKVVQTKRTLTRVVVANPQVADVELLADQPEARLLNVTGKSFGTTSLTLWDESNRPVSFLVRVTVDSKELETRVNQAFPGAQVKVRQVGSQIILDGQVPEAKMMSDILQVVQAAIRTSPGFRMTMGGGGAMGGAGGGTAGGAGGMGGGGSMGGGMGGGMGLTIINRVVVPGPRQVLLHVKIAELNRTAMREIGVSWLDTKGRSIIGSSAGGLNAGGVGATASASHSTGASNPIGLLSPVTSTFDASGTASSGGQLFGVFNSGHFSLFINALRANGLSKILAEPNLVALDGQPARFLVGGNLPYPVPQSSSIPGGTAVVTIQFARIGTILNFIPQILANDVIRLDVEPVVSNQSAAYSFTYSNGQTVNGIAERSARTVVELREGQTLAIAGLIQIETLAQSNRIPGLGDLPLVGPWFSNITETSVETETMILVTPELVAPLDKNEVTEAPGDRVYQPNDAEFFFLGRMEGKLGREFRAPIADQDPLRLMKHFQSEQQWVLGPHGYAD
ncbi:MAG: pilus assembly protein N-terminal domain-containing protein [Isosphaeraceae bacterium]